MKRKALVLIVAAFCCLLVQRAVACPYCNIFNRLAESVQESTDIFRGEILRPVDRYRAEVKVLKVLRGTHAVGATVTTSVFRHKWHVGDKFVFCENSSMTPAFGTLDPEIEDEILFLLQGKPELRSLEEAIQRVQGVSVDTHKKGMEYIADHYAAAVKPLVAELDSLTARVFSNEEVFFGEHRLANLAEALFLKPTDEGRDFLFSQIDAFPNRPSSFFGWSLWLALVPASIGASFLLAGYLWLATHVFRHWRFPRSLWSLLLFLIVTTMAVGCVAWYSYGLFGLNTWVILCTEVSGISLLLVGMLWLGTRLFLHRPFPNSLWSLLMVVTVTAVVLGCAARYLMRLPSFYDFVRHFGNGMALFVTEVISLSLIVTGVLWIGSHTLVRRPFPHSWRSLLVFVAVSSMLLGCAAWYWYPVPYRPSSRAVILRDMLRPAAKHQDLLAPVREHLFDMCATRTGTALAEAVYAIVLAGVATPDELQTRLTNEDADDMLALGLYLAGNDRSQWWDMRRAHDYWNKSLSVAQTRKLKTAISRQIKAHPERAR